MKAEEEDEEEEGGGSRCVLGCRVVGNGVSLRFKLTYGGEYSHSLLVPEFPKFSCCRLASKLFNFAGSCSADAL